MTHRHSLSIAKTTTAAIVGGVLVVIQALPLHTALAQTPPETLPEIESELDDLRESDPNPEAPLSEDLPLWLRLENAAEEQHIEIIDYIDSWLRDRVAPLPSQLPAQEIPDPFLTPSGTAETTAIENSDWEAYRLGVGDAISVVVQPPFQDLSTQAQLSFQGTIFMPLLGTISLEGLTVEEATDRLTRGLNQFVVNPDLQVILATPRQAQITVTGEVARPGFFPIAPNAPLAQALLTAGGVTLDADLRRITVERRLTDGRLVAQTFDFYTPLTQGAPVPDVRLRDGDVILVPVRPRGFEAEYDRQLLERAALTATVATPISVTIAGEVARPGYYDFPGRPVPEVDGAILAAQGTKINADLRRITVRRQLGDGTTRERTVDLFTPLLEGRPLPSFPLENGDVVIIPELSPEDRAAYDIELMSRTSLASPTVTIRLISYPSSSARLQNLPTGSRLADALGGVSFRNSRLRRVALIRFDEELGEPITSYYDARDAFLGDPEENPILQDRDVIIVGRNFITKLSDFLNTFTQPFRDVLGFLLFFDQLSESADNLFAPTGDNNNNRNNN